MAPLPPPTPPKGFPPVQSSAGRSNSGISGSGRAQSSYAQESIEEQSPASPKRGRLKTQVDLNNLPDLLTIREVSELLRVSPLTIKRWGKRGKLPAIRINSRGDRRYKKTAVLWLLGMTEAS